MILSLCIFSPLAAAVVILFLPGSRTTAIRPRAGMRIAVFFGCPFDETDDLAGGHGCRFGNGRVE